MEVFAGVGQCNIVNTVFDLSSIAVVLAFNARRVISTFGRPCFINATDRIGMSMLRCNESLTFISKQVLIPNN